MKRTHLSRTKWFDLLFRAYRRKESASTRTSGSRALSAGQGGKRIPSSDKVTTHDPAWDFRKVFSQLLEVQARPWPTWPSGNKSIVNPTARSWSYFVLKCLKAVMEKWGCMDRGVAVLHFEYYISKTLFHHKISSCFSQIRHIDSLHLTFLLVQRVGGKQQGQEQLLKKKLPLCSAVLWTWLHAAHLAAAL